MQRRRFGKGAAALAAGIALLAFALGAVPLLGAAQGEGEGEGAVRDVVVEMSNFAFSPSEIVVAPGERIRFLIKNPSSGYHTFTVAHSKAELDKPLVDADAPPRQDQVVEMTMPSEEITLYLVCLPHESLGMVGSIVVSAAAAR